MATPQLLSPSTWRVLGLSVAAGYVGLGAMAMVRPAVSANLLGVWPTKGSEPEAQRAISTSMALLGVRDISIGLALFAFDYRREPKSMGVVILSTMALCFADCVWVYRVKGPAQGFQFIAGATIWGWIGLNLLEL